MQSPWIYIPPMQNGPTQIFRPPGGLEVEVVVVAGGGGGLLVVVCHYCIAYSSQIDLVKISYLPL